MILNNALKKIFAHLCPICIIRLLDIDISSYLRDRPIKRGDVVIDAGAYNGIFTIIASRLVGKEGKVIAFEPNKDLIIQKKAVKIYKIGLWNKLEIVGFCDEGATSHIKDEEQNKIVCVPFDSLNIGKVDFVKMDIEGAEIEALEGMKETLLKYKPHLAIATYHIRDGKTTQKPVENYLKSLGYKVETKYSFHLTTIAE